MNTITWSVAARVWAVSTSLPSSRWRKPRAVHVLCRTRLPARAAALLLMFACGQAGAAVRAWDGGGANPFWTTAANWSGNIAPAAGDSLEFAGAEPFVSTNDYSAGFDFGGITFSAPGYVVRGNAVGLADGITLLGGIGPIEFVPDIALLAGQTFTVSRVSAAMNLRGTVTLNGHTPRFFAAGTVNLWNTVSGIGGLIQDGGMLVLHADNSFSGSAALNFGTCMVLGANPNINVTINSGAALGGTGLVRRVTSAGGALRPGSDDPGILSVSATTVLDAATLFGVRLNGPVPGTQYDRLVTGSASLGGATLQVSIGYPLAAGEQFIVLESLGEGAVTGTFGGLPEGALFMADNMQFQITYTGGDGNDVVLIAIAQQPTGVIRVWEGGGANHFWTTPANWAGEVAPSPGDTLEFPAGAAQLNNVNDYPPGTVFNAIDIGGAGYNISGSRVALISGTAVRATHPAGVSTLGADLELLGHAAVVNFIAGVPHLILSGDIDLGGFDLSFVCEGPITVSGVVSGAGGVFKGKNPPLRFAGAAPNTYTGPTTILGLCELGKTPGVTAIAGPLNVGNEAGGSGEVRLLASEQISNVSTVTVFTAGTFNLNGFDETISSLCLTGGVVTAMSGTLTLLGGVETKPAAVSASISGNLALSAGAGHAFNIANGPAPIDLDISAAISGPADAFFLKTGAGQLRFSGSAPNTFTGATRVHAGTLLLDKTVNTPAVAGSLVIGDGIGGMSADVVRLAVDHQIMDTAPVTVTRSGRLDLNGRDEAIGPLAMSGGRIDTGGGLLILAGHVSGAPAALPSVMTGRVSLGPGAARVFDIEPGADMEVGAVIDGGPALTLVKTNQGRLFLTASNLFSSAVRVFEGTLVVSTNGALGNDTGATFLNGGTLKLLNTVLSSERLVVHSGTLRGETVAAWNGDVVLNGDATVVTDAPTVFTFTGLISGSGGFIKNNNGGMRIRGSVPNTFTGATRINDGGLDIYSLDVVAIPGPLVAGDGIGPPGSVEVRYGGHHQIADTAPVTLNADAVMTVQGWSDTIGSLSGTGGVELVTSQFTLGGDGADATYAGVISGDGSITKIGAGAQTFAGDNTYLGETTVSGGTLIVQGAQPASSVFVHAGATLGGSGTVGRIDVLSGGRLSPGGSPGILSASGIVNFQDAAARFRVELDGPVAGAGYGQLNSPFGLALNHATLEVTPGFTPAVSHEFTIIDKGGVAPVVGTFNGLPEGATFAAGGLLFTVTYTGGDGNDVVLTRVPGPAAQFTGITPAPGGAMHLMGLGEPGLSYLIEATANLNPPRVWTSLGAALADGNGVYEIFDDHAARHPARFYRAQSP